MIDIPYYEAGMAISFISYLIWDRRTNQTKMESLILDNTKALRRLVFVIERLNGIHLKR